MDLMFADCAVKESRLGAQHSTVPLQHAEMHPGVVEGMRHLLLPSAAFS